MIMSYVRHGFGTYSGVYVLIELGFVRQMPSIFVRTLNGSVAVPQQGSVKDLKDEIEARSGFAAESVCLAYNGHILQDDELLEELQAKITIDL
jgi:hypothetical protein